MGGIESDMKHIGGIPFAQLLIHNGCNGHILGVSITPGRGHQQSVVTFNLSLLTEFVKIVWEGDLAFEPGLVIIIVKH